MGRLASFYLGVALFSAIVVESMGDQSPIIGHRRGVPGEDFPVLATVPVTKFRCIPKQHGYYVDVEALCQVFHICQEDGRHDSFLCPNGTLFNQKYSVCDWWYNVDCKSTQSVKAAIPVQETVPVAAAREPSRHGKSGILPVGSEEALTVLNAKPKDTFGSKMPSVNRMGGVNMALMGNFIDASDVEMIELTEAPTTVQPLSENESIPAAGLSVSQLLSMIPVLNETSEGSVSVVNRQDNITVKSASSENIKALSADSRSPTGSVLIAVESGEKILSTGSQSDQATATATLESNPVSVPNSAGAAGAQLNAFTSFKELVEDVTTTSSLSDNPASLDYLSEPLAITQEESTESVLSGKVNSSVPASVVSDSVQSSNLLTLEVSTRPTTIPFKPTSVLRQPGPLPTPPSGFLEPPAVVGISFNVITEPSVAGTKLDANTTTTTTTTTTAIPVDRQLNPPSSVSSTTKMPGYPRNMNLNSTASILWPPSLHSATVNTTDSTAPSITSPSMKSNDETVAATLSRTQPAEQQTLNGNLKPAILPQRSN